MNSSSMQEPNPLPLSHSYETNFQQQPRKEGFTAKFRQTINAADNHGQGSRQIQNSEADLSNLTPKGQELILHAIDMIKKEDSESVMSALDESRDILRNSFEEFKREQDEYRKQLEEISKGKEAAMGRRKENAIPLSVLMRQKRDVNGLADLRSNTSMNPTYQAYFQALLSPAQNTQQHPTDKAAVVKYIRRRERRKRAEENKKHHQLSGDVLERQTAELMQDIEGMDIKLEHERQRQNEILHTRMNEKKIKTNNIMQANEIIDLANEADLARQRVEQTQREKIEARLSAARQRNSSNMIHIQSHTNEVDDEKLNEEQIETTKKSLQLLNNNKDGHQPIRSTTPVFGDKNTNDKRANIQI